MECYAYTSMEEFAVSQTSGLVNTVVENICAAADQPDPEAVHKLRVSIRRLQQALRLFKQFFPKRGSKRMRKQLRAIMKPAGELRNRDIAIELLEHDHPALLQSLKQQRVHARRRLVHVLTGMAEPGLLQKWRTELALKAEQ